VLLCWPRAAAANGQRATVRVGSLLTTLLVCDGELVSVPVGVSDAVVVPVDELVSEALGVAACSNDGDEPSKQRGSSSTGECCGDVPLLQGLTPCTTTRNAHSTGAKLHSQRFHCP